VDDQTIHKLNAMNRTFYETVAEDFDATRQNWWPGWERLLDYISLEDAFSVLDVGCGNGRFGLFLAERLPVHIHYTGIDNNPTLLQSAQSALVEQTQVNAALIEADVLDSLPLNKTFDLVVTFGLLHHIPGGTNRLAFARHLALLVAPDGYLAFANWRFYEHERFRQRIIPWPPELANAVEAHDYLLDWRRGAVSLRYCHYVDDAEQQALITATGLNPVDTYRADGESGDLNAYSILKRTKFP
jgi:SAM-dependent methyltransferase